MVKVKAIQMCYYNNRRHRPGTVFEIEKIEHKSSGMQLLSAHEAKVAAKAKPKVKKQAVEVEADADTGEEQNQDVI